METEERWLEEAVYEHARRLRLPVIVRRCALSRVRVRVLFACARALVRRKRKAHGRCVHHYAVCVVPPAAAGGWLARARATA